MSSSSRLPLSLEAILKRYQSVEQRLYQIDCIRETVQALNEEDDVLINLPTGTGKTFIYAPIAIEAATNEYRTCVLCATKDMQKKILADFCSFPEGDRARSVYGVNMYHCPRIKQHADNWTCDELRETCIAEDIKCDVLRTEELYSASPLVITNYSKFLKYRSAPWSLIVIDDSHAFEGTKEEAYQRPVHFYLTDRVASQYAHDPMIGDFLNRFRAIFVEIFETSLPPNVKQGALGSDYVKQIGEDIINENTLGKIKSRIRNLPDTDKKVCIDICMFIDACQKAVNYNFYVRKDFYNPEDVMMFEMIAREAEARQDFLIKNRFEKARIVLATATPGDPEAHSSMCTNRDYKKQRLRIVPQEKPEVVKEWFKNLNLHCVMDLGDTRDIEILQRALDLASEILASTKVKTLLLFKNYRDQGIANQQLQNKFHDIFFIDDSYDEDSVVELASKSQIILASASTRLWEGLNVKDLRLGIIFTPPFIRVPVHIPEDQSYPYNERIMLRRLQQGIGRLIRDENDCATCILMDVNFGKKYVKKRRFSDDLRRRIIPVVSGEVISKTKEHLKGET